MHFNYFTCSSDMQATGIPLAKMPVTRQKCIKQLKLRNMTTTRMGMAMAMGREDKDEDEHEDEHGYNDDDDYAEDIDNARPRTQLN